MKQCACWQQWKNEEEFNWRWNPFVFAKVASRSPLHIAFGRDTTEAFVLKIKMGDIVVTQAICCSGQNEVFTYISRRAPWNHTDLAIAAVPILLMTV